jgi:SAM-dependent methyltransferase
VAGGAVSAVRRLRWRLGTAYAAAWRRVSALVERAAPRSARAERAIPLLPPEPVDRKYGLGTGRPVDRVYIEGFLERHADDIRGRVLEILDDTYTRRFGGAKVGRADVLDNSERPGAVTVRGDLVTGDGIPRAAFDCFICTQTLSLIYDLHRAVANAHDLLAPGGVLLLTVPGISQQADPDHEEFPDYWRFTKRSVQRLLAEAFGADNVDVEAHGTVQAAGAFLYGLPAERVDPATLAPHDADYEMVVCARAVRVA